MFTSISVRTAEFPVPMDVQELMSVPTAVLTFKFLDPVECLIRLLTVGPLSADDMDNMAFKPRLNHGFYEDFVDGERLKRVYAALRPGCSALTSVLFFDAINRDRKGSTYVLIYVVIYVVTYVLIYVVMYVLIYVVKHVLIYVVKYVLIYVVMYVLICVLIYVLKYVMMYVLIYVVKYVLIYVVMYVLIYALMYVLMCAVMYVLIYVVIYFFLSFEDLTTEMRLS
jgi:hypothetical protein